MTQSTDLRPREPDFIAMRTGNQRESHGRARLGNAISACLHVGRLCRTPLLRPIHNYGSRPPSGTEDVGISVFCKDANGQVFHTYSCYSRGVDMLNGVSLSRSHTQGTRRSGSGLKSTGLGAPPRRIQGLNLFRSRVRPLTRATAPEAAQSRVAECGVSLRPHMPRQSEGALARKKAVRRT